MNIKLHRLYGTILSVVIAILSISATNLVENNYILSKDYTVKILGTSNLHNWDETVETVTGACSTSWNSSGSFNLKSLKLQMEVHSIKSDMGGIMNNNTYKALKADAHPEITFALSTPVDSINALAATTISAKGNLTIAGVTKPIIIQVKATCTGQGKLSFEGSQSVKMTDYGIEPPTALFGRLKTGDIITLNFKTTFVLGNNSIQIKT